jgi:hypothetical protein
MDLDYRCILSIVLQSISYNSKMESIKKVEFKMGSDLYLNRTTIVFLFAIHGIVENIVQRMDIGMSCVEIKL